MEEKCADPVVVEMNIDGSSPLDGFRGRFLVGGDGLHFVSNDSNPITADYGRDPSNLHYRVCVCVCVFVYAYMYVCMFWIVLLYTYTLSAHTGCDYTYIHNDMVDLASLVYIPTHINHIACMLTWSSIIICHSGRLGCVLL